MIDYKTSQLDFRVGDFILSFPTNIRFDTFNDPKNYYGIIFYYENYRFEVIESQIGTRLLINGKLGEAKDLPFSERTAHFLPSFIATNKITEIKSDWQTPPKYIPVALAGTKDADWILEEDERKQ